MWWPTSHGYEMLIVSDVGDGTSDVSIVAEVGDFSLDALTEVSLSLE